MKEVQGMQKWCKTCGSNIQGEVQIHEWTDDLLSIFFDYGVNFRIGENKFSGRGIADDPNFAIAVIKFSDIKAFSSILY